MVPFPHSISLTITNYCNLRCKMCGQWSEEGYMHGRKESLKQEMHLADWMRVVDELAEHKVQSLLLRGGEIFLFPGIIELMEYIHERGIFIAIDTNGTLLEQYAEQIIRIGSIHLTISIDGPEAVHDAVRGIPGTYARIREGVARLRALEEAQGRQISKSFNFTISPYALHGLAGLPDAAREMGVGVVCIVPYYYFPAAVGQAYEAEMAQAFGTRAFSWVGFHHEQSGVDPDEFQRQHQQYLASLRGLTAYPYMPMTGAQYQAWFEDAVTQVFPMPCGNIERLIDIQPNGDANFCVDFPDYVIGNVRQASIAEIWTGERAERFRRYRREKALPVCARCGARFMSETPG